MRMTGDTLVIPTAKSHARSTTLARTVPSAPPQRTAPFDTEPGFHGPSQLWLYGNAKLLDGELAHIPAALGPPDQDAAELEEIERQAEELILEGKVLVCGIHNPAHQRCALIPLRWGAPRVVIFSGGFHFHLGEKMDQEPFRAARLWRYSWDSKTDLAISRRAPDKMPTFALHNPTVDKMIARIALAQWEGLRWTEDGSVRVLA